MSCLPASYQNLKNAGTQADFVIRHRQARVDARKASVIELRFFGGLSVEETAEVLQISAHSVMRDWKLARAWLVRELG